MMNMSMESADIIDAFNIKIVDKNIGIDVN